MSSCECCLTGGDPCVRTAACRCACHTWFATFDAPTTTQAAAVLQRVEETVASDTERYVTCERCRYTRRGFLKACPRCEADTHRAETEAARGTASDAYVVGDIDPYSGAFLIFAGGRFAKLRHQELSRTDGGLSQLRDQLGALRTENDELLRENARLRREVERLQRKGGRR